MVTGTAFVLVPGLYTGGWIWEDVVERLRAAGAEAYPLTLSGMGEAGAADLEAHISDVLRAVEGTEAREVVLVGHCYGVHPVVGAADRSGGRVTRVVLADTPMPQDGDPPAVLVPEQAVRAELLRRISDAAGEKEDPVDELAPPSAERWRELGSFQDLDPAAADLLIRRAVPQPVATLTQPLRLDGAVGAPGSVPVTGLLCTANGSSVAMVEQALRLGNPRFDHLADLTYIELGTGHWPMLSDPAATADALLRAAAGEGTAARRPSASEPPTYLRPFLLDVPECPRERDGRVDFHLPAGQEPCPAVVFVHGGPVAEDVRPTPRDWPAFVGYGRLAAQLGAVGVIVDHRLHDVGDYGRAADDVRDAVALARSHPRVDADRVAVWFLSTGGLLAADWLAAPPPWLRCLALTYPLLAPPPGWGVEARFRPAQAVRTAGRLPIVLTRVGRERHEFALTVEAFLTSARDAAVAVEVIDVPSAGHGFDTPATGDAAAEAEARAEARRAVELAARTVVSYLAPLPTPAAG